MCTMKNNIQQRNKMHAKRMAPALIRTSSKRAPDNEVKSMYDGLIVKWRLKNTKK